MITCICCSRSLRSKKVSISKLVSEFNNKASKGQKYLAIELMLNVASSDDKLAAEEEGLDKIFLEAGFDWRLAGCSMCLAMNEDQLIGDEACASSSNRNLIGRQGSKDGRTILMSPVMVAAAAITGEITDVREMI